MSTLAWIVGSSLLMSAIALVGSVTLFLKEETLQRIILPLIAFAAGSLIGGAFFHMIPAGIAQSGNNTVFYVWILAGFSAFFALEQLLNWRHCHRASENYKRRLTYLILIGDGLHNFIGGLAIAGIFITDIRLGIMAWLAAAAHEIPQELGDFGVLIHWRLRPRTGSKRARKSSCQHCEFHCIHIRSCIDAAYQGGAGGLMFWNSRRTMTGFLD